MAKIAFGGEDGTDVTYTLKNGKTVKHSYVYVKDAAATGEAEGREMDTTAFKDYPGYENASMYIELSAEGQGKSYVDMTGSGAYMLASEYPFYTYGTKDASGTEKGVYLVVSGDEGLKTATYEISEKDGVKTLLFNSTEGVITYYGRNAVIAAPKITKTKVKKSKTLTVSWKAVENADGYEVTYSTSKKFKKAKTVSASKASAKIKNLKKKNYYVKVRGYVLDPLGNKIYGEYSQTSVIKNK